ncbi:hypothetical protein FAUST_7076 [Fusarium austroamericanum]|uniref:Aminoglycoside phosphotransferase domain-containing protein n=1 Tax=Fusarium austroamericanum TaxID=282268 RepID=A0AAN5Z8N1_FUSAU|nr:hypothetical protein FAUST_7076 [Fusarium austroamericanum]
MIIKDLGSRRWMDQALEAPRENLNDPAVLRPDISETKLNSLYIEMAESKLPSPDGSGSFRLWCDDFRPANVLIDDRDRVIGAIDWEFAYAAPTVYFGPSLVVVTRHTWILVMQEAEQEVSPESCLFSAYMPESWTTGRFWLNYAARKSWAFDTIYWKYLDEKFFGEREDSTPGEEMWKTRVHLLSEEERAAMEPLVQAKMAESKTRVLIEWEAESAKEHLSCFLFD